MLLPDSLSSFYHGEQPSQNIRLRSPALLSHEEDVIDEAVKILVTSDETKWTKFLEPWGPWKVTLAHVFAYNGNLQILKCAAIQLGACMDSKDEFRRTPLHYAAFKGHVEIVNWLLKEYWDPQTAQAQISARNSVGNMPLHEAIEGLQYHASRTSPHFNLGNLEVIKLLVDAGADVNSPGGIIHFNRTAKHGSPLILVGAEIVLNVINRRMWYEKAVDIFVSAGTFVNLKERDSCGLTMLHHAAYMGSHKVIKQIVKRFEDQANRSIDHSLIDTKDHYMKCTPLYWAAHFGHVECVRVLVDFGANLTSKNKQGQTVLHILFRNCASAVALLTDILNTRVRSKYGDKLISVQSVKLNFGVLGIQNKLQMAMVSDLIEAAPTTKDKTILQHPLLEAFLQLKWLQLRKFFFVVASIHFFGILLLSVPATILLFMGGELSLLRWPLLIWSIILIFYNLLQFLIMPKYFLTQSESYVSMVIVVAGLAAQYPPVAPLFVSTAFLFAWIQLMLVVGRILTWGHYIHMYTIVLSNVSKALSTYVFLIIGFTFSFSILLCGNPGFTNPWMGFVKTVAMMTGEYDSSTVFEARKKATPLNNVNSEVNKDMFLLIISTVIFLLFVILAGIVLMNLITGLAVAEVQKLVKKGQLFRLLELAKLIAHLEQLQRKCLADLISTYWRCRQGGTDTPPDSEVDSEEEDERRQGPLEIKIDIDEAVEEEEGEGILQTLLGKKIDTITELDLSFHRKLPPGISGELREDLLNLASKNLKKFQRHLSPNDREDDLTETVSELQKRIKLLEQDNQQFVCNVCKKCRSPAHNHTDNLVGTTSTHQTQIKK